MSIHTTNVHGEVRPSVLLLETALSLAQTQLVGQLADETSVDGRTMGTLGFSGALLAFALAAKDALGALWWVPLLVLSTATLLCLVPTLRFGADSLHRTDLGPGAYIFYQLYNGEPPWRSRELLLSDLDEAFARNTRRLRMKERVLSLAVMTLAIGLPFSAVLIGLF
jgi:hypothetical protein